MINFFKRISLKRMWYLITQISKETKLPKLLIFFDMIWCFFVYKTGYLEYRVFGFAYIRGRKRSTFVTSRHNKIFVRKFNDPLLSDIFENKIKFCKKFSEFLGRDFIDLKNAKKKDFEFFIKKNPEFFVKSIYGCGGKSVRKIKFSKKFSVEILMQKLKKSSFFLAEGKILQNETMSKLCPACINTVRIVTILVNKNEVVPFYSLVRVGNGEHCVDNISSGGMYAPINENGTVSAEAFCDLTGIYYKKHPKTNVKFSGFQIPFYSEAIALVKKASLKIIDVRYIGWDVAISKDGPVLVEGNTIPGYDMCQNYYHLGEKKEGILNKFLSVIDNEQHPL